MASPARNSRPHTERIPTAPSDRHVRELKLERLLKRLGRGDLAAKLKGYPEKEFRQLEKKVAITISVLGSKIARNRYLHKKAPPKDKSFLKIDRHDPPALFREKDPPVRNLEGSGLGDIISSTEGLARLDKLTTDDTTVAWADSELLGAGRMAERLGVARTTLNNWRTSQRAIAFQKGVRNYVYPIRQFHNQHPVVGIERILPQFDSPEEAWEWLVTANRYTHGEPPIERLRSNNVDEVAKAAEGKIDFA